MHNKTRPGEAPQSIGFHLQSWDAWLTMQASHFSKIRPRAMRVVECAMCFLRLYFPPASSLSLLWLHTCHVSVFAPARELIPWNKCTNNSHALEKNRLVPSCESWSRFVLCVCFTPAISHYAMKNRRRLNVEHGKFKLNVLTRSFLIRLKASFWIKPEVFHGWKLQFFLNTGFLKMCSPKW